MGLGGLGVDVEESVARVESYESARSDWRRFRGKNFANPPTDFERTVGVLSLSPESVVEAVGVRPSTGAMRSSSSSSSSSEERPSSWKSGSPGLERIVPIPSVYMQIQNFMSKEGKERRPRSGTHRGSGNDRWSRSVYDFGVNVRKLHEELSILWSEETELDSDGALRLCASSRGQEGDIERLRITGDYVSVRSRDRRIGRTDLGSIPSVHTTPWGILEPVLERKGSFSEVFFAPGILIPGDELDGGELVD